MNQGLKRGKYPPRFNQNIHETTGVQLTWLNLLQKNNPGSEHDPFRRKNLEMVTFVVN